VEADLDVDVLIAMVGALIQPEMGLVDQTVLVF